MLFPDSCYLVTCGHIVRDFSSWFFPSIKHFHNGSAATISGLRALQLADIKVLLKTFSKNATSAEMCSMFFVLVKMRTICGMIMFFFFLLLFYK